MNLIECVPNVSEGRRPEWVAKRAAELQACGVALLDFSADPSHHRSVFTMAASADRLHEAIIGLAAQAIAGIDLRTHRGEHPRLGALDVVPFIPLGGTPMSACVSLATDVGRALATSYALPIYLYEAASRRPERRRLEAIRRGEFEGLAAKMKHPEWTPDFGPHQPHPTAGASIVGARRALIAFNVNLETNRLPVAQTIARRIRESNGGLPAVKAMAVTLAERRLVQVSMNLTNYEQTPVQVVFDRIQCEANAEGVRVLESELIGLIPAAALSGTTAMHLKLTGFTERQILEVRLREQGFDV